MIHGLTVCVGYADKLALGIERWLSGLDSLLVITDHQDTATYDLCERYEVGCYRTDAFYEDGASFNKGKAISEAAELIPFNEWVLLFDSDIVPPADWKALIDGASLRSGNLYGADRHQCDDPAKVDSPNLPWISQDGRPPGLGYFQLFHGQDPAVTSRPLMETHWAHAGNADNAFRRRWPRERWLSLPMKVVHVGPRHNWYGLGNPQRMQQMWKDRMAEHQTTCEIASSERL